MFVPGTRTSRESSSVNEMGLGIFSNVMQQ